MKLPSRLAVAAMGALALAGAATGIAYAATSIGSRTSDALIKTTSSTNLSSTGGVYTVIETLTLPPGKWVLQADNTMVNFGPSDYTRCVLFSGSTGLNGHASMVGDPNASGAQGPGVYVATLSETSSVKLSATTKVGVQCGHDNTNGSTPYIDSDATLWAHRAKSLVQLTTP